MEAFKQALKFCSKIRKVIKETLLTLLLIQRSVSLVGFDQISMSPLLNQFALIHHQDKVTAFDRTQTMGNKQDCTTLGPCLKFKQS